ncbi:hypothetical protein BOX37_12845 [Nocardia mangyaensis]|uniref:Uncharacterized protein n=1 Tax=Nocardia mangyaensis TaxID=2213200 RepID=A0A1J0VRN8_9NOCA|nr:hypothetical protein BOX37_12845 [Nocardia mangyaensis]
MLAHCNRSGLIEVDRVIPDNPHVRGEERASTPVQAWSTAARPGTGVASRPTPSRRIQESGRDVTPTMSKIYILPRVFIM